MNKTITLTLACALILFSATTAMAHFGMIIPDKSIVPQKDKTIHLKASFSHPFEGVGMDMERPKSFKVYFNGKETDLTGELQPATVMDHKAWALDYKAKRPGMYAFAFEPVPYAEPAEDNYIIHYTKTMLSGFDGGEGWDVPLGLKTEIIPLTRPWGNYAGNVFQGMVLLDGKPAPHTRVEVEFYNRDGERSAPSDCMITQEVLCDENGVFTFACPWKGWWGFAGLNDADYKIEGKDVELGAVLWVEMK